MLAIALLLLLLSLAGFGGNRVWAQTGADHPADQPLKIAADVGFAPFAMRLPSGEVQGFSVDVGKEIAKRLGRPGAEIIDVNWSAIFAGLFAKRYEFIIAPTNITPERAERMLFTEGYMQTGLGFLTRKAVAAQYKGPEDLKGKTVTVNNGSVSDTWATENAARYGFKIQRYDKNADAIQAVVTGRADVNIADLPASQYAATQQPLLKVAFPVYTGRN
ncbi:MAG: polar amino acid ABC transporter substrate-binding protein, partial [Nitrospinota bacterium]